VGEFILLLHGVSLQVDNTDKWLWTLETSHVFSVRSAYNFLTFQPSTVLPVAVSSLWNKDIPLKVVMFAWRLFRDRLPTKDNLLRRGVIHHEARLCVTRYRFFGMPLRGKYGKRGITGCLMAKNAQFYRWLIKLSR